MVITHNNKVYEGVAILPQEEKSEILIEAKGSLDLFTMRTCHREWTKEKAWNVESYKRRLFWKRKIKHKNKINLTYIPTELEMGYCPMELGGFEIQGGRHSWALIDFRTEEETLEAEIMCNGDQYKSLGVSICQSRKGLVQVIKFNEQVEVHPTNSCDLGKNKGKVFEYITNRGECVYAFRGIISKKIHRLTTLGYEKILIREIL